MNNPLSITLAAAEFAARSHTEQKRKGAAQEPYINHLIEVARLLSNATDGADPALVAAGFLHDTIEDTSVTREELMRCFGPDITGLVAEVTDDKALPSVERKRLQIVNAPHKSDRAKMIKIADKISNLRALINTPPVGWNEQRKREYYLWARQVTAACGGVNPYLDSLFDEAFQVGLGILAADSGEPAPDQE